MKTNLTKFDQAKKKRKSHEIIKAVHQQAILNQIKKKEKESSGNGSAQSLSKAKVEDEQGTQQTQPDNQHWASRNYYDDNDNI